MASDALGADALAKISRFKGQVHAFDLIMDLEEFLIEKVEVRREDIQSTGIEPDYQG